MMPRRLVVLVSLLSMTACRGPKSSPEGTVDSFFSAYEAHDADALVRMTLPKFVAKHGEKKIHDFYWDAIVGIQSIDVVKSITSTGKGTAQAQCSMKGVWRIRGENPSDYDDEISLLLHEIDGKWYIEVPGTSKINPW